MIETPNQIQLEIKPVLSSVLAWQSYWLCSNSFAYCAGLQYRNEIWIPAQDGRTKQC